MYRLYAAYPIAAMASYAAWRLAPEPLAKALADVEYAVYMLWPLPAIASVLLSRWQAAKFKSDKEAVFVPMQFVHEYGHLSTAAHIDSVGASRL
ncbi:hypothetical protein Pogu_0937 [Pyrobaculum oguniense TE7]|uniref:Uncharacterized protein n=1 Tax=Pyrobaculum oguniense (strain DSM 13380 / JCM 10595 / TE7) TaxID=698757 RepID=H6Q8F7_PYROT|nr:hypothetical protein Pogu_0937 [Pyrobaculum oguniense TE7]